MGFITRIPPFLGGLKMQVPRCRQMGGFLRAPKPLKRRILEPMTRWRFLLFPIGSMGLVYIPT